MGNLAGYRSIVTGTFVRVCVYWHVKGGGIMEWVSLDVSWDFTRGNIPYLDPEK